MAMPLQWTPASKVSLTIVALHSDHCIPLLDVASCSLLQLGALVLVHRVETCRDVCRKWEGVPTACGAPI